MAGGDFVANQHGGEARAHGHSSYLARQAWRDTTFVGATALPCSDGALKCFQWEDYQLDFAVITLEEDVSSMYGAFGLDTSCGRESLPITAAGYPADRPGFPLRMFYDTSILSAFDSCTDDESEGIVTSGIETQPGQSGSAIWVQRGDESLIRAIHIASGPAHRGVTAWMVDRIEEWTS